MEFEEIYDDVQVTTGVHSTTDDDRQASQYVYDDLVPKASAAEYTNLSGIKSKHRNANELNRLGYKSLMVLSEDDAMKNEYAIANQSGDFSLDESSNNESSSELVRKTSNKPLPVVPKRFASQKKSVSVNEPSSAEEDKELKADQKEVPKRDFRVGILYCLVLISIVISLAALAIAVTSIVWSVQQMPQYMNMTNCFMKLLQNESFCGKCFEDNATLSEACMSF